MMLWIQSRPQWQRAVIFFAFVIAVVAFFVGITVFVIAQSVNSTPRSQPYPTTGDVAVSEFVQLPDDDAYPAALALVLDGTLYTGSYASGVVWAITPDGDIREVPGTRDQVGSVTGLTTGLDGTLYILDRIEPLVAQGASIWRLPPDGELELIISLNDDRMSGVALPDDIAVDLEGRIYISDRGRDRVLRFAADGSNREDWWISPPAVDTDHYEPTGLAYDAAHNAILITDGWVNAVYRVPVGADDPDAETEVLYFGGRGTDAPGLDGVDATASGQIYLAGLGANTVFELRTEARMLDDLAGGFRGASDVAYDVQRDRLYVTNWDQRSLLPVTVLVIQLDMQPRLPFSIDMIELNVTSEATPEADAE